MIIGILNETRGREKRVAMTPQVLPLLKKLNLNVLIESGAGAAAGFSDESYIKNGAEISSVRDEILSRSDIVLHISPATIREISQAAQRRERVIYSVGMTDALWGRGTLDQLRTPKLVSLSLDLMPRISRAQSMDVLSSMSTVAGYEAVLIAAAQTNKIFPMLTTAAGTLPAAKVLILGAGVAGLQAMATAKRLGAMVSGYDIRAATVEQIISVGAKPVLSVLDIEQKDESHRATLLENAIVEADAVITTALAPGRKAPVLITKEMVRSMKPSSVIVDIAAEHGGNCELTIKDETHIEGSVSIIGPTNLSSRAPFQSSQMFSKNALAYLKLMISNGILNIDLSDEIFRSTLVSNETNLSAYRSVPQKNLEEVRV